MSDPANQYDIIQKIGEGGMGTVFLANDRMLDRKVAIKQLNRSSGAVDESIGDRFQQEALALARLNHPNITHLYSFIPREDTYWMVMEYVEGKTLEDWLHIHKKIAHVLAASIAVQILDGLYHAHRKGIIHRDIKPANVMINDDGEVKIMDFGIARMKNASRVTRHGKSVGTIEYMAPEQVQGQEGDERTDVYAVANVMYELLCGIPPYQGDTDYQLMKNKLENDPAPIHPFNPAVPVALQKVIFKALERNADKRYATAMEFRQAIEKAMDSPLLPQSELTRVLKASQVITTPQTGSEVLSVGAILARAQRISKSIKVPVVKKQNRPWVFLAASVIICALLLLIGNSFNDDNETASGTDETSAKYNSPVATGTEQYAGSSGSLDETPSEMYNRISNQGNSSTNTAEEPVAGKKTKKSTKTTEKKEPARKEVQVVAKEEVEEKTVPHTPVDVPAGTTIHVTLDEDISSEEVERDGSALRFTCADNIVVEGRTIIRKGAPVRGKIVDVIPSSNARKKALVGFVLQQVQAVDGSTVKLNSERFRLFADEPGRSVSYRRGQSFSATLKRGRVH